MMPTRLEVQVEEVINNSNEIPKGIDFLSLVWQQENGCETETDEQIPTKGERTPACWEGIGTVLSFLDRMASCFWGCQHRDHIVEYLCGRIASNARAAVRLIRFGFYDESLALSRGIGEVANLLLLFSVDEQALDEWRKSSRRQRMYNFGPMKVRTKLEGLGWEPVVTEERYRLLSEGTTHVHPETKPQSHNILGIPTAGARYQEAGLLVSINELAIPLSAATALSVRFLSLDKDTGDNIMAEAVKLTENIGGITITAIGPTFTLIREKLAELF